jgi:hypothetical protein
MHRFVAPLAVIALVAPLPGQVDQAAAVGWFAEADSLCRRDDGKLWGISLCGPMVIADRATQTRATNKPAPEGPVPPLIGVVNAPVQWGGERWAAYTWPYFPVADRQVRGRLLIHELFHRVQPQLGMYLLQPSNDHLDQLEGRYWLRLEWRALAAAIAADGDARLVAINDALGFRIRRRALFRGMTEREHADEIREGLAQYTGTVIAAQTSQQARSDAMQQLLDVEREPTFVRTFAYPSGSAYGVLLDLYDPGWTRRFAPTDDLGNLLAAAAGATPTVFVHAAALRYDGRALRAEEERRDAEQKARVAELRLKYVDGPLVIVPRVSGGMLITTGAVPIPGVGTVYREYRLTAQWGTITATKGLLDATSDGTLRVAGPWQRDGKVLRGDGWEITVASGWAVVPGERAADLRVVRDGP